MSLTQAYRGGDERQRPGWWLHLDYSAYLVEEIKGRIPHTERTWDEDKKRWWVSDDYVDEMVKLVPSLQAYLDQPRLF